MTPGRFTAPAIIIGLDSIQGLQVARILHDRGVPVIGIAERDWFYACRTRVCEEIHICNTGGEDLINLLESIGPALPESAVLFPCKDPAVLAISKHRERLATWYRFVLPDHQVVEDFVDKERFYRLANDAGLDAPRGFALRTETEASACAETAPFPLVLKPPNRDFGWNQITKKKAFLIETPDDLIAAFRHYHPYAPVLIAQEWIDGSDADLFTCNAYFDRSQRHIVSFVSKKIRQYPPRFGQGCSAVPANDEEVEAATRRIYERVGWRGFAYLEMKRDPVSGRLVAIEPNAGRPTGRSAMAEANGVELHLAMYCDAIGAPLPPNLQQSHDYAKWIHLLRDLQSAVHYIRRRELTIGDWIRSLRGSKSFAVWSLKDPMPFLAAIWHAVPVLLSARERGSRDYSSDA